MSGLAARVKIDQLIAETGTQIPWSIDDQATFWKERYTKDTKAKSSKFKKAVQEHENGQN